VQGEPLTSDSFERVLRSLYKGNLFSFALLAGIDTRGDLLSGCIEALARVFEADIGIDAERDALFLAVDPILESPQAARPRSCRWISIPSRRLVL
jgi:hypothetical protein